MLKMVTDTLPVENVYNEKQHGNNPEAPVDQVCRGNAEHQTENPNQGPFGIMAKPSKPVHPYVTGIACTRRIIQRPGALFFTHGRALLFQDMIGVVYRVASNDAPATPHSTANNTEYRFETRPLSGGELLPEHSVGTTDQYYPNGMPLVSRYRSNFQ